MKTEDAKHLLVSDNQTFLFVCIVHDIIGCDEVEVIGLRCAGGLKKCVLLKNALYAFLK